MVWAHRNSCDYFYYSDKQKTKTAWIRLYPSSIAHHKPICSLSCCDSLVLVEYHNIGFGDVALHRANGALEIIKWGQRLLWVALVISFYVAYGYFHVLITYTFLGSIVCIIVPAILFFETVIKEWSSSVG